MWQALAGAKEGLKSTKEGLEHVKRSNLVNAHIMSAKERREWMELREFKEHVEPRLRGSRRRAQEALAEAILEITTDLIISDLLEDLLEEASSITSWVQPSG